MDIVSMENRTNSGNASGILVRHDKHFVCIGSSVDSGTIFTGTLIICLTFCSPVPDRDVLTFTQKAPAKVRTRCRGGSCKLRLAFIEALLIRKGGWLLWPASTLILVRAPTSRDTIVASLSEFVISHTHISSLTPNYELP